MKMLRLKWLLPVAILFFFTVYGGIRLYFYSGGNLECPIKPFDEFAYLPDDASRPIPKVPPGPPWQAEAVIPGHEKGSYAIADVNIKLARTRNGEQEIWIFERPYESWNGTINTEGSFLIYHPKSQTWQEIPAKIRDTDLIVTDLFVTSDGTVWGEIGRLQERPFPPTVPVLSQFNESAQRFEAAAGGLDIPIPEEEEHLIDEPSIVLDKQDIFWIFVKNDGIYRYDPKTQITNRQTDLPDPDIAFLDATLSLDGSIYFRVIYPYRTEGFLFQFIPTTGEIVRLEVPNQTWRYFGGMLVDYKGRLWLGAMGYLETNRRWHLIHPHPRTNYKHLGEPFWVPPTLIFESSDGLLWYAEDNDMERFGEGTAWYNPETGEGCLFTNLASYIVEDAEKQLWMVADGKLYRYPLMQ